VPAVKRAAYVRLTEGHPFVSYGITGDEALRLVDREQIVNRIHLRRQCKGYLVDPEYLDTYRADTAVRLQEWEADLEAESIAPGNSGSLTTYLEDHGLLPEGYPRTPKTGKPSGEKANLKLITHPIAETFVQHKETRKLLDDYLSKVMDNSDDGGRIHPGTHILGAATGRQSISGDAPLHQFPAGARGIILADDHEAARAGMRHPVLDADGNPHPCTCTDPRGMVSIDWAQIEAILVANIAGDTHAVEAYERGENFFNVIVDQTGIKYKAAKKVVYAQLYGEGIVKLAADLRVTVPEARKVVDLVWATLPGTRKLVDKAWKGGKLQSIAQEYRLVFTLSGRIVPVPSGWWPCWQGHESQDEIDACHKCNRRGLAFSVATHKGVNYFVQGSAYDLLAEAEVEIDRQGLSDAFYLAMHDELVVDAQAAHDVRKIMETPPGRLIELAKRTPILRTDMAHLGERWAAA
jgi:DNA polymerase-1